MQTITIECSKPIDPETLSRVYDALGVPMPGRSKLGSNPETRIVQPWDDDEPQTYAAPVQTVPETTGREDVVDAQIRMFNGAFGGLRTIEKNGEPMFCAADVCRALEIGNNRMAVDRLDDDEKGVFSADTLGGKQNLVFVTESGLYSIVLGSRKPEAKAFKRWITHDVIPQIRRTGQYTPDKPVWKVLKDNDVALLANAVLAAQRMILQRDDKIRSLEEKQTEDAPKVEAYDEFLSKGACVPISVIAQDYGMTASAMNKLLSELGIIYNRGGVWYLHQSYVNHGYTKRADEKRCGLYKPVLHWTPTGRKFLYDKLKESGYISEKGNG